MSLYTETQNSAPPSLTTVTNQLEDGVQHAVHLYDLFIFSIGWVM